MFYDAGGLYFQLQRAGIRAVQFTMDLATPALTYLAARTILFVYLPLDYRAFAKHRWTETTRRLENE